MKKKQEKKIKKNNFFNINKSTKNINIIFNLVKYNNNIN